MLFSAIWTFYSKISYAVSISMIFTWVYWSVPKASFKLESIRFSIKFLFSSIVWSSCLIEAPISCILFAFAPKIWSFCWEHYSSFSFNIACVRVLMPITPAKSTKLARSVFSLSATRSLLLPSLPPWPICIDMCYYILYCNMHVYCAKVFFYALLLSLGVSSELSFIYSS